MRKSTFTGIAAAVAHVISVSEAASKEWIRFEAGDSPLIIATGHGGSQAPKGWPIRSNPGILNAKDSYTWPLSKLLCERIQFEHGIKPYWVLNTVHRQYADVNRPPGGQAHESPHGQKVYDAFHEKLDGAVRDAIERFGFAFVVDIHGQSRHPLDIYLGTARRKSMDDMLRKFGEEVVLGPKSLQKLLEAMGYSTPPDVRPPGAYEVPGRVSGGYVTHHYGRRINVDAVQIEVHGRIRKEGAVRSATANDLADALAKFCVEYIQRMMATSPLP